MITFDANKLLVPSPPIYDNPDEDGNRPIGYGKDPDRSVASGILGSFNDAPGYFEEDERFDT